MEHIVVNSDADITVSDSMVKALLDAGIFTADAASTIKVDASGDIDGHVATTLEQLAHIGADQVVVADATPAYVDLGNVTNEAELDALFTSLNANEAHALVTDADGNAVSTGLLLTSEQAAALNLADVNSTTKFSNIGIDKIYVADVDGTDLTLGLEHFRELHNPA